MGAATLTATCSSQDLFLQKGNATLQPGNATFAASVSGPSVTIVNNCPESLYSPPGHQTSLTHWTSGTSVAVKVGSGACGALAEFHFQGGVVWYDVSIIKGFNYAISSNSESCYSPDCNVGYNLCCTQCTQGTKQSSGAVTFTFCPGGQTAKSEHCC